MHTSLEHLKDCADSAALRAALHDLCLPFGDIERLDILPAMQGGRQQALCFLRLPTEAQEQRLMDRLGIGRFGGEMVVVIELSNRWAVESAPQRREFPAHRNHRLETSHAQHPVHFGHAS